MADDETKKPPRVRNDELQKIAGYLSDKPRGPQKQSQSVRGSRQKDGQKVEKARYEEKSQVTVKDGGENKKRRGRGDAHYHGQGGPSRASGPAAEAVKATNPPATAKDARPQPRPKINAQRRPEDSRLWQPDAASQQRLGPPRDGASGRERTVSKSSQNGDQDLGSQSSDSEGEQGDGVWADEKRQARQHARALCKEGMQLSKELIPHLKKCKATDPQLMAAAMAKAKVIQAKFAETLLLDIKYAHGHDVEMAMWRAGFYAIIEEYRREVRQVHDIMARKQQEAEQAKVYWRGGNSSNWNEARERQLQETLAAANTVVTQANADLCLFLQHGIRFYQDIVNRLQMQHGFRLAVRQGKDNTWDGFPEHLYISVNSQSTAPAADEMKMMRIAQLTIHRCFVFMGDLERYRQTLQPGGQVQDWSVAANYYMCARWLVPRNAKPYNQLAVLATFQAKYFQAVYYYIRSLAVKAPIMTARDALLQVFEKARTHTETHAPLLISALRTERQAAVAASKERNRSSKARLGEDDGAEQEVWILDHISDVPGSRAEEADAQDGVLVFLHDFGGAEAAVDRMELHFLYVLGALLTRAGLERVLAYQNEAMEMLEMLLNEEHGQYVEALPPGCLVQLMAAVIFMVHDKAAEAPPGKVSAQNQPPTVQVYALHLFWDIFASLASVCASHVDADDARSAAVLEHLLPALRVALLWMQSRPEMWLLPALLPSTMQGGVPVVPFWSALSTLANTAKAVIERGTPMAHHARLWEDKMLYGMMSLAEAYTGYELDIAENAATVDLAKARLSSIVVASRRISELVQREYEVQTTPLVTDVLTWVSEDQMYYSDPRLPQSDTAQSLSAYAVGADDGDMSDARHSAPRPEREVLGEETTSDLTHLRARKMELSSMLENVRIQEEEVQTALEKHRSAIVQVEVTPQTIVFDTNCYISHLETVKSVVATRKFTVILPLVVWSELKGLRRGQLRHRPVDAPEDDYDPAQRAHVQKDAEAAIEYLLALFEGRNNCVKAMTTKGSFLTSLRFATEQTNEDPLDTRTNDDLILSCCLLFIDAKADDQARANHQPLKRRVVLVTDDRNLRIKVHACHIPVRGAAAFVRAIGLSP